VKARFTGEENKTQTIQAECKAQPSAYYSRGLCFISGFPIYAQENGGKRNGKTELNDGQSMNDHAMKPMAQTISNRARQPTPIKIVRRRSAVTAGTGCEAYGCGGGT
jgi:hypothetical protein